MCCPGRRAFLPLSLHRRDGRVVDCGGLENRCTARYRGFESLSLRNASRKQSGRVQMLKQRAVGGLSKPLFAFSGHKTVAPVSQGSRHPPEGLHPLPRRSELLCNGQGCIGAVLHLPLFTDPQDGGLVPMPHRACKLAVGRCRIERGEADSGRPLMGQNPQDCAVAQHTFPIKEENGASQGIQVCHSRRKIGLDPKRSGIFARPEKCQSGRMGLTRNQVCPHGYRGFESLLLRQNPDRQVRVFYCLVKSCTKYTYD